MMTFYYLLVLFPTVSLISLFESLVALVLYEQVADMFQYVILLITRSLVLNHTVWYHITYKQT